MSTAIPAEDLKARRSALLGHVERILDTADKAGRGITDAEQTEIDGHSAEVREIDHRLKQTEQRASIVKPSGPIPIPDFTAVHTYPGGGQLAYSTTRSGTYARGSGLSYFRDLLTSRAGDSGAAERLERHAREVRDVAAQSDAPELRAIGTGTGSGADFAPPLYLLNDYVAALRPGRPTADALTNEVLPDGAPQVNIPKIATGTATAIQSTQNTAINVQDVTTSTVAAPVYTIAGGQLVAQQLLDQSSFSGNVDEVILKDLTADYAQKLGAFVLNGSGTNQPYGLFNVSGITAVSYADATPGFVGAGKLYSKIAQAVQTVQTSRFAGPTAIVMHPRRWAWISVQTDTQNRPVVVPNDQGPNNATGVYANGNAQGVVGRMFGLPVILDANILTNLGAGTNQDQILVGKLDDSWLFESHIRAEAFTQTYAQNLSVFIRLFNYVALAHRTPQSLVAVGGTGLVAPTF